MLREDPLGGHIDDFEFRGSTMAYHVDGWGNPVLITHGLSAAGGSYDWRYIYDCIAGAFLVYALDVIGPSDLLEFGRAHYSGLIEAFIRQVIRRKTSVIASPREAPFVLQAAFEAPQLVDRVMLACPDGAVKIRTHGTIGRGAIERKLGIPSIDEVAGGWPWRMMACGSSLRRYATGRTAGLSSSVAAFRRSGAQPGGIDPLRFCDGAMRFLG
jgi:pimeloyl-ACP methyl ester carboxylesterase